MLSSCIAPSADAVTLLYSDDFTTAQPLHDTDTVGDGTGTVIYNTTPTGPAAAHTHLQSVNPLSYQVVNANEWELTELNESGTDLSDGLYFQELGQPTRTYYNWATSPFASTILSEGGMSIAFDVRYSDIGDNNAWMSFSFGTGNVGPTDGRRYNDSDIDYGIRVEGDRIDQVKNSVGAGTFGYDTPLTNNMTVPAKVNLDFSSFALGATVNATTTIGANTFSNVFTWDTANDFRFSIDIGDFLNEDDIWVDNLVVSAESSGLTIPNQWVVDGGGSFNTAANWSDNTVPGVDALFGLIGLQNGENSPATITLDSPTSLNSVTIDNSHTYLIDGPESLTLTGDARVSTVVADESHEIHATIAGSAGLEKTGVGNLVIAGANTFTGATDVQAGTLVIQDLDAIDNQASGSLNIAPGATATLATGAAGVLEAQLTGGSSVVDGDANLIIEDAVTINRSNSGFGGVIRVDSGTLTVGNSTALGDGGEANDRTVIPSGATSKVALTGGVVIANEVLDFEGRSTADIGLSSTGSNTWNGIIRGEGNDTLSEFNIESTSGTLTLNELYAEDTTGDDLNYVFSGAGNTVITGRISDADIDIGTGIDSDSDAANVSVIKRGTGTLTLANPTNLNADYWFGDTTIEAGTLKVNASGGTVGELRSASIMVKSGATFDISQFSTYSQQTGSLFSPPQPFEQAIRGSGSINVGSGTLQLIHSAELAPGDAPGQVGTLTVTSGNVSLPNLTGAGVATGGIWKFDIGNSSNMVGDRLDVASGNFTAATGAIGFNITPAYGSLDAGSYTIISHSGAATPAINAATAQITDAAGNALVTRQTVSVNGDTAGQVNVVVSGEEQTRTWNGNLSGAWDVSTKNWQEGADNEFRDLDQVVFDDTAAGTTEVTVAASRSPSAITFANNSSDYTFSGPGNISTAGPVNVTGTGQVVLGNENNRFGAVTINAGSNLQLRSATTGSIANNGSLSLGVEETRMLMVQNGAEAIGTGASYKVLAFEAEDYLTLTENQAGSTTWSIRNDITGSSGVGVDGEALYATEQTSLGSPGADVSNHNYVTYDLQFSDPGTYTWFLHMVSTDGGDGSSVPNGSAGDDDSFWTVSGNMDASNADPSGLGSRIENFGSGSRVNAEGTNSDPLLYDWYRNAGGNEFQSITVTPADVAAGTVFSFKVGTREGGLTLDKFAFVAMDDVANFGTTLTDTDLDSAASVAITNQQFTAAGSVLDVAGDFTMTAGSDLNLLISTSNSHDQLAISGLLTADGTLNVAAGGNGFSAGEGDVFDLFSFGSVSGSFTIGSLPTLAAGLGWDTSGLDGGDVFTGLLEVIAVAANLGDYNGDLIVDARDYAVWRENFGGSSLPFNESASPGTVDSADFDVWLANYGADYTANAPLPTPEPSAVCCLLLALVASASRRNRT